MITHGNKQDYNIYIYISQKKVEEEGKHKKPIGDSSTLGKAEKNNINGKKASTSKESILTENWNPKDMKYGMNGK
jgi:hypothetical protein